MTRGYNPLIKLAKLYDVKLITKDRRVKRSYSVGANSVSEFTETTDDDCSDSGELVRPKTLAQVIHENETLDDDSDHLEMRSWDGGMEFHSDLIIIHDDTCSSETTTSFVEEEEEEFPRSVSRDYNRSPSSSSPPRKFKKKRNLEKIVENTDINDDESLKDEPGTQTLDDILGRLNKIGEYSEEDTDLEDEDNLDNMMAKLMNLGSAESPLTVDFKRTQSLLPTSSSRLSYSIPSSSLSQSSPFLPGIETGNLRSLHNSELGHRFGGDLYR